MKKALLSMTLVLAANSAFAQVRAGNVAVPTIPHDTQFVAQAYPATARTHYDPIPCKNASISANNEWSGPGAMDLPSDPPSNATGAPNSNAVGGVLSLASNDDATLNSAAFATCRAEEFGPAYVQSYRLKKSIPGSKKCPNTFGKQEFFQFGTDVRTWWTLIYTQPGTRFELDLTVVCFNAAGHPVIHVDKYSWEVVATFESLLNVLDVLHQGALGTTEIPCIAGEDMFDTLVLMIEELEAAAAEVGDPVGRAKAQDLLFGLEACIISFACFADCFIPEDIFSAAFPPSNTVQFGDYGFTGIIDTLENPCACKLIVDLEYIAVCYGIASN